MESVDILGVRIDEVGMEEAINKAESFIDSNKFHMIFTPNPEFIMKASKDEEFKKILCSSDLNIPDGNGIVWASKKIGNPLKERVSGFDFVHKIFNLGKDRDISFYFLGAMEGVAKKAKDKIEAEYLGINVVGLHNGFFEKDKEEEIIAEINELQPDVLLVAMGAPKQEKFISKYKDKLKCKIAIGVGGCFDVMAGNVKRAPKFFIECKLEWLYRGITDLKRFRRLAIIPEFMMAVKKHARAK